MSGTTIDTSMPFHSYAMSFDDSQLQTYLDFSPVSIFDPAEDFGTDFTSDSDPSPVSPLSPALSASSFGFPAADAWTTLGAAELPSGYEDLFGCQTFFSCPPSGTSLGLAINPMDLAAAPFSSPSSPLELSGAKLASMPAQQQQRQEAATTTARPPTPCPTADAAPKRYPSRGLKRKSTSPHPSDDGEDEPAPKLILAGSPRTAMAATATMAPRRPSNSKRKDSSIAPTTKKSAHNMIEKRYRTNLNGKITQLRDAVPSLRELAQQQCTHTASSKGVGKGEFEDAEAGEGGLGLGLGQGVGSGAGGHAAKLNKATILTKATEYILQLERRNHGLETENNALRGRMEGLEMLLMGATTAGATGGSGGSRVVAGWD